MSESNQQQGGRRSERIAASAEQHQSSNAREPPRQKDHFARNKAAVPRNTLRIAIDYGTFDLKVMYQLKRADGMTLPITPVDFGPSGCKSPMWLYVNTEGDLIWGHEVKQMVQVKQIQRTAVIRQPKLSMHPGNSHAYAELVQQISRLPFEFNTVEKLIKAHLEQIVDFTVHKFDESTQRGRYLDKSFNIKDIEKEIHLGVPEAWNPTSNQIMATAAQNLGINGQLVSEPQCVAAFAIDDDRTVAAGSRMQEHTDEGTTPIRQLVVDAGGGTVDLIKFETSTAGGAKARLETIGRPSGELKGSALINDYFVDQIHAGELELPGGFGRNLDGLLADLNMTNGEFRFQASEWFENKKLRFLMDTQDPDTMRINGASRHENFDVPRQLIQECIQWGIKNVTDMVQNLIDPETKVLILSGCFGASRLMMDALKSKWPDRDQILAARDKVSSVAYGALLRHDKVELEASPAGHSYFTTQFHEYVHGIFPDADADSSRVTKNRWHHRDVVEDRIANLLETTDVVSDLTTFVERRAFTYWYMEPANLKIEAEIFWSEKDLPQHAALQDYKSSHDDPDQFDYELLKTFTVEVPEQFLKDRGYVAKPISRNGPLAYKVKGRIVLRASGASMHVLFQVCDEEQHVKISTKNSMYLHDLVPPSAWTSSFQRPKAENFRAPSIESTAENDASVADEHTLRSLGSSNRGGDQVESDHESDVDVHTNPQHEADMHQILHGEEHADPSDSDTDGRDLEYEDSSEYL